MMIKLAIQDWRDLKKPLIILGVVMGVTLLLALLAQRYHLHQTQALQAQKILLNLTRQRYQSSGAEKEMIMKYLPQYQALINKGLVGGEQRAAWIDALWVQQKEHQLFAINYSINPQENYQATFSPSLSELVLHRSIMKLNFDLLHEGDVLQLVEALNAEEVAPLMLRDCEITRLNIEAALNDPLAAHLHAQCELDWLTIHQPESTRTAVTVE